jgi:hypothetical protein
MTFSLPSHTTAVSLPATKFAAALLFTALLVLPMSAQTHEWPKDQSADTMALRSSASPAEKKLSFNLLLLSRQARHASLGAFASAVDTSVVAADGTVTVEVIAYISPSLMVCPVMADIIRVNGAITETAYISDHLHIRVSQSQLLDLAANPNVWSIRDAGSAVEPIHTATKPVPADRTANSVSL